MKIKFRAIAILSIMILVVGCSNQGSKIDSGEKDVERNLLTGLPGTNQRILAAKVDDTRPAHPQVGLESADVIYIEQVEGGMTRLVALYSSYYPVKIGPIRSARISDIDILAEYGRVGLIFSGAQRKMYPIIDAANIANIGAQRNPPTVYVRDPLRNAPTNMFVYPEKLLEVDTRAEEIDRVKSPGWIFGENPGNGEPIVSATVSWPNTRYKATWSEKEDRWLLDFNGEPNLNPDGYQLGSPNFIIQIVEIVPSGFGDRYGGITPKSEVIGNGRGYLLRDGVVFEVKWSRPTLESVTRWTFADGRDAPFEPGQIWIALTENEPEFEKVPEEAVSAESK